MAKLSVVINTFNEESNLPGCLDSVRWADDIVVVDNGSADRTVAIAEQFGCRVLFFDERATGYPEPARNFAIAQAAHEWVLVLDADERASAGLPAWLADALDSTSAAAFMLPRRNFYRHRWLTCCGWFPDRQLRLYRKTKVSYSKRLHRPPQIDGAIVTLPLDGDVYLEHLSFPNLTSRIDKLNLYATVSAKNMLNDGRRVGAGGMLGRAVLAFVQAFVLQKGFRHGQLGMFLALERAFFAYLKAAKLWELQQESASSEEARSVLS